MFLKKEHTKKYVPERSSSSIQTVTVGFGISPNHARMALADYTAGRELHPALKNITIYFF